MTDHKLLPRVPTEESVKAGVQFALKAKVTDSWPAYISELYQIMFDAAPAAEMPGWGEWVERMDKAIRAYHPQLDGQRAYAGEISAMARVPELLARVGRLEEALRDVVDVRSQRDEMDAAIVSAEAVRRARAALENKP